MKSTIRSKKIFTREYFERYFSYCSDDGLLRWKTLTKRSKQEIGDIAGKVDREGYISIWIGNDRHRAHRAIWMMVTGSMPDQIDHINGNRSDNRIENLRSVTNQENSRNRKINKNNISGHLGVCWYKRLGKWHASIRVGNKRMSLGYFSEKNDAVSARKSAETSHGFHANHGSTRHQYFDSRSIRN